MINARMPGFIPSFLATGVSFAIDLAGERELIPVRILEDGDRSPGLVLGFLGKSDAFALQHVWRSRTRRHTKRQWTETRQCAAHDLRAYRGRAPFRRQE